MSPRIQAPIKPQAPAAKRRRSRSANGRVALLAALADGARTRELSGKVAGVAQARYRIPAQEVGDLFHEAVLTYLSIAGRYPENDNHFGLLVGVFHKKCLEHLGRRDREQRGRRRFATRLQANRPLVARGEDPRGAAVERAIRDEEAVLIQSALHDLDADARDMLLSLAEGRRSRLELVEELGVNRNTFDTRLRALRLRLRQRLSVSGVCC